MLSNQTEHTRYGDTTDLDYFKKSSDEEHPPKKEAR